MEKDKKIPYGYLWFNGIVLTPPETDLYNRFTARIEEAYYESTKEDLRDLRHMFLICCFENRKKINHE